jgi:hypothetical protein
LFWPHGKAPSSSRADHDIAPVVCRGAIMSAAFGGLRAIRVHIAALRAAGINDYANLRALFSTLEKMVPEATARRVADIGFYFA